LNLPTAVSLELQTITLPEIILRVDIYNPPLKVREWCGRY
jgi:hypothetical protein